MDIARYDRASMSFETLTARQRVQSLSAVIATAIGVGTSVGAVVPLVSLSLERDGYSAALIGINTLMFPVGVIAFSAFVPRLVARLGMLKAMCLGLVATAALMQLFPLIHDFYAWCIIRFFIGTMGSVHWVASETWINLIATDRNRSRVMALYATVMALGFVCGPVVLTFTGIDGWLPFAAVSAATLFGLVPLLFAQQVAPNIAPRTSGGLRHMITAAPTVMLAALVAGFVDSGLFSLIPVYEVRAGFARETAALSLSVFMAGNLLLQLPLGWLADHTSRRAVLLGSGVVVVLGAILYPLLLGAGPWLWVMLFLWGGVSWGIYTLGLALMAERFTPANMAGANAAFVMMYEFGSITGPVSAGFAMDIWHHFGMPLAIGLAASALVLFGLFRASRR
jgi:MFS family permease